MKISLKWILDFVDLKVTDIQKIADKLSLSTAEIEVIEDFGKNFLNVVTGELICFEKHPRDSHLHIGLIDLGRHGKKQIVFGSVFSVEEGFIMPIAMPGAKLLSGLKIEKTKIKGVISEGMIASDEELGISISDKGLTVFPSNTPLGRPIAKILHLDDIVFDIDNHALTNRSDLFSQYGFAREFVANRLAVWKKDKETLTFKNYKKTGAMPVKITISNNEICKSYCAVYIGNLEIAPSPLFLKKRLLSCGIRPISNIVDITNYVMLELGMPLHAFDLDMIQSKEIFMRKSMEGEKVVTLDNIEHKLKNGTIVIEDHGELIDLCGIMGGKKSGISHSTEKIILHSPVYNPVLIRKTIWQLGIRTDAATIYEKGVSPELAEKGIRRALQLIRQIIPSAEIRSKIFSVKNIKTKKRIIPIKKENFDRLIGVKISENEIKNILKSIGCRIKGHNIITPNFRPDLKIEADLIEEVSRIHGFDKIKSISPRGEIIQHKKNKNKLVEKISRDILCAYGYNEVFTFSFLGKNLLDRFSFGQTDNIEIENPISKDMSIMRQSLLPRIIEAASQNIKNFQKLKLFEISKVYLKDNKKIYEEKRVSGLARIKNSFFEIKGAIEELGNKLNISFFYKKSSTSHKFCHPARNAEIYAKEENIGFLSQLHPNILKSADLDKDTSVFEINFEILTQIYTNKKEFASISPFPSVPFDVCIIADIKTPSEHFTKALNEINSDFVKNIKLTDIYEGKSLPENKKSLTFSITFQSHNKTLTEEEIKNLQSDIIKTLEAKGGKLRV